MLKLKPDRAIEDHGRALAINPRDPNALVSRAKAWINKGQFQRAIDDCGTAIWSSPNYPMAYNNRGIALFLAERYALAALDLRRGMELESRALFVALWEYLANHKAGNDAHTILARRAAGVDRSQWPGALVQLYLGETTPEKVLEQARSVNPATRRQSESQAMFYLGHWQLVRGEFADARRGFESVIAGDLVWLTEYPVARVLLKSLDRKN